MKLFQGFKIWLFDLDGTLVFLNVNWKAVEEEIRRVMWNEGIKKDIDTLWKLPLITGEKPYLRIRKKINEIFERYEREAIESNNVIPNKEIMDFLLFLSEKNIKIGIVSNNTKATVKEIIKEYNLPVETAISRDDVIFPKPYPEGLEKAVKKLRGKKRETIYVGDCVWDLLTGRNAKISTLLTGEIRKIKGQMERFNLL